jgi:hypothetical protein
VGERESLSLFDDNLEQFSAENRAEALGVLTAQVGVRISELSHRGRTVLVASVSPDQGKSGRRPHTAKSYFLLTGKYFFSTEATTT